MFPSVQPATHCLPVVLAQLAACFRPVCWPLQRAVLRCLRTVPASASASQIGQGPAAVYKQHRWFGGNQNRGVTQGRLKATREYPHNLKATREVWMDGWKREKHNL